MDERFPKRERLLNRRQFREVYARGTRVSTPHLALFAVRNQLGHSRLGITVTRRIGKSVVRNRVRRWVREAYRRNKQYLPGNYDVVVNALLRVDSTSYQTVAAEWLDALRRLGQLDARDGSGDTPRRG